MRGEGAVLSTQEEPHAALLPETMGRARLFVLFDALEQDLRAILRHHVVPYQPKENLLGARAEVIAQRAVADGHSDPESAQLVEYLDFADSFALINRHHAMVPEATAELVRSQTPRLESLIPVRNRVMHIRPLHPDDPDLAVGFGVDLLDSHAELPRLRSTAKRLVGDPTWSPTVSYEANLEDAVLHNLPAPEFDETGFIGRAESRAELKDLLVRKRYPVITVLGEGGNGKTALAVQVLYDLVDLQKPPYEIILWTSLKTERLTGQGIEEITTRASNLLGMTHQLGQAIAEDFTGSLDELSDVLQGTEALVVIDNLESASAEEVLRLIDRLPEETVFLLTSRVGLGQLERRLPLGALTPQAAEQMFRKFARRRNQTHLATLPKPKLKSHLDGLRYSPLAIRWYIEAIDAGAQPDELLRDQSQLLRFCMESIHEDLSPGATLLLGALFAAESPVTVNELAILTELATDELRAGIHELQRRSFVNVEASSDGVAQIYQLAASTRDYLAEVASPDAGSLSHVEERVQKLRRSEERRKLDERRHFLAPKTITVTDDRFRPVAHLLREAFAKPRREIEAARELVRQARDLEPDYFEVHRVQAFLESRLNVEEARHAYERAYALAPPDAKPKVAYFFAPHLAKALNDLPAAEAFAQEAHDSFGLPETAHRLGQIKMFREEFDGAKELLETAREGAESEVTRVIVETELAHLAKRQVEHLTRYGRRPAEAFTLGFAALEHSWEYLDTEIADQKFLESTVDLAAELSLVLDQIPPGRLEQDVFASFLEGLDRRLPIMTGADTTYLVQHLRAFAEKPYCSPELRNYIAKIDVRLKAKSATGRLFGSIQKFSQARGYGFLIPAESSNGMKFEADAVSRTNDMIYLSAGTPVSYKIEKKGNRKVIADVMLELNERIRKGALRARKGKVLHIEDNYMLVRDFASGVRVFVAKSALRSPDEWHLTSVDDELEYDIQIGDKGPRAVSRSARLAAGGGR